MSDKALAVGIFFRATEEPAASAWPLTGTVQRGIGGIIEIETEAP